MAIKRPTKEDPVYVTTAQLQHLFNIENRASFDQWRKKFPECQTALISRNKWDLKLFLNFWLAIIFEGRKDDESLTEIKTRYWGFKAEEVELKVKKERGSLYEKDEVQQAWAWRLSEVKTGMLDLVERAPPQQQGKTLAESKEVLRKEIVRILDIYAREGRYCT